MDAQLATIICAIIGSGALSTLIAQLFAAVAKRKEKKSGMANGIRLILKDRLRFLCLHYIGQGWIYADELEDILAMHGCYHAELGGNGYLDALMSQVKKLPIHGQGK